MHYLHQQQGQKSMHKMGRQRNTAVDTREKYVIVEMGRQCYTTVDTREKSTLIIFENLKIIFFLNK